MTLAFVTKIIPQTASPIITWFQHAWVNFTAGTIVPWWAKTATICSFIYTRSTVVTTSLSTVVYGGLTVMT